MNCHFTLGTARLFLGQEQQLLTVSASCLTDKCLCKASLVNQLLVLDSYMQS